MADDVRKDKIDQLEPRVVLVGRHDAVVRSILLRHPPHAANVAGEAALPTCVESFHLQIMTRAGVAPTNRLPGTAPAARPGCTTTYSSSRARAMNGTPQVAVKRTCNAIDGHTTLHPGHFVSQRMRRRVEKIFGWTAILGLLCKLRHRGKPSVASTFEFTTAVYNLVRMHRLLPV